MALNRPRNVSTFPATGAMPRIAVVYRRVADVALDPKNARLHSDKQIGQIASSIRVFGFVVPVLIDAKGRVIAGAGRVLAARKLGLLDVPTILIEHLTEAQARALALADNKITLNATWDERLLAEQLKDLSELNLDFTLEEIGFETAEVDLLIEGLDPERQNADDPADALPASGPAVSKLGDLWLLDDRHRILCGDALDGSAYAALLGSQRAEMVFTDPPYGCRIDGHVSGLGAVRHREFVMGSDGGTEAERAAFLNSACTLLAQHSADGSLHYVCMDWRGMPAILSATRNVYSEMKNLLVWVKDNGGMGSLYRSQHELIFLFKSGLGRHRNNIELGKYGRTRTNVLFYPGANSFSGRNTEEGNLLSLHPTVKPVALVADLIKDCTARGDIVLDVFIGSGTTAVAAEGTGRRCFGMELDPLYVDTSVRRWQAYTGKRARHAVGGRSFDELEAELAIQSENQKPKPTSAE